jgi:hypothetical protein
MCRPALIAAVLTASLATAAPTGQAVATAAPTATAAAGARGVLTAAAAGLARRPVFLVTGQLVPAAAADLAGADVMTGGPGPDTGTASPLEMLSQGGTTRVMPVTAAPYAGRGLAPALFEPAALARAESGWPPASADHLFRGASEAARSDHHLLR